MMMLALLRIKLTQVDCPLMVNSHTKFHGMHSTDQKVIWWENSLEDAHARTHAHTHTQHDHISPTEIGN